MENNKIKLKYPYLWNFLIKTMFVIVIAFLILTFVFNLHRMTGNQMFPSVRDGDLCIFYKLEKCYTNDVVLYENANGTTTVGRIVAVNGQTVDFMKDGGYEVDGNTTYEEVPYETYASEKKSITYPVTLSDDEYFILNDFRLDTSDSREYGPVKANKIKGKLLFQFRRRGF